MAFLEDPRLRQRWNQIAQDAETVTENAAAGIWTFQHNYINPCLGQVFQSIEQCTSVCLGDPEERRRRQRERDRQAEYTFDFYDDWYEEEEGLSGSGHGSAGGGSGGGGGGGGLFGSFRGEDWDRLLAGTGSSKRHATNTAEATEQPKRKRGMSYGTRGAGRRKTDGEDPTIIPSTHSIGFLGKLPWKMGGTLRYKPSAADLQDHPGMQGRGPGHGETAPLLGRGGAEADADDHLMMLHSPRKRSGTTGSGDTSDSYRSRGDLFPSDEEGEEDAVPLDDEVTYDMVRKDDRSSSGKTRSSKGKRPAFGGSRSVSRTTIGSVMSQDSSNGGGGGGGGCGGRGSRRSSSFALSGDRVPSMTRLAEEEQRLHEEEEGSIAQKKAAAAQLAAQMGLAPSADRPEDPPPYKNVTSGTRPEVHGQSAVAISRDGDTTTADHQRERSHSETAKRGGSEFVPARLPRFG